MAYSADAITWTAITTTSRICTSLGYNGSKYLSLTSHSDDFYVTILNSSDGITWTRDTVAETTFRANNTSVPGITGCIVNNGNNWLMVGGIIMYSTDNAITWNHNASVGSNNITSILSLIHI